MIAGLLQNPIANMPGPLFLFLYLTAAMCCLIAAYVVIRLADPTRDRDDVHVPENPDPYEIAYLRGGTPEVTRLAVFDLMQRGIIEFADGRKILGFLSTGKVLQRKDVSWESIQDQPILLATAKWFTSSRKPYDIYQQADSLVKELEPLCGLYESKLEKYDFLESVEQRSMRLVVGSVVALGLILLAAYKIVAALSTGHSNILFLIFLTFVSIVATIAVCKKRRLSDLGRRYLEQLQLAFASLKGAGKATSKRHEVIDPSAPPVPNPALLLGMGVFGVTVLQNTAYGDFYDLYRRAESTATGCGSGCGAGGGGGCGGGGCGGGGCGGGCGGCGGG